jgi:ribosomal protein S18 acetylase RimI-like enzyme
MTERTIALLHWFRRLRIRWEIRDDIHEAFMPLAAAIICWRHPGRRTCRRSRSWPPRWTGSTARPSLTRRRYGRSRSTRRYSGIPPPRALLAWDGGQLAGFAAYSFVWPAVGLTGSLYLKELYVSGAARRAGVGAALMQGLARIAVDCECSRVEWTTDQDNAQAQAFYESLGTRPLTSKVFYRLAGDDLLKAADVRPAERPCRAPRLVGLGSSRAPRQLSSQRADQGTSLRHR